MRAAPDDRAVGFSERLQKLPLLRWTCRLGRHRRSRAERYRDVDGLIKSSCVRCGARMVRQPETGRWLVHGDRDRRRRTRPYRRMLDQLTGPVLFLMGLALVLGLTIWLRGIDVLGPDEPLATGNAAAQKGAVKPGPRPGTRRTP